MGGGGGVNSASEEYMRDGLIGKKPGLPSANKHQREERGLHCNKESRRCEGAVYTEIPQKASKQKNLRSSTENAREAIKKSSRPRTDIGAGEGRGVYRFKKK